MVVAKGDRTDETNEAQANRHSLNVRRNSPGISESMVRTKPAALLRARGARRIEALDRRVPPARASRPRGWVPDARVALSVAGCRCARPWRRLARPDRWRSPCW